MKINVRVKPGSKQEKIDEIDKNNFTIWLKEKPDKGMANKGLIKLLKKYFKVPISNIRIQSGLKSKNKVVEIEE